MDALDFCENHIGSIKGHVLDVGAGVAWSSAIISKINSVKSVTAVDFSEHRLKKIAPIVFKQLNGNIDKFEFKVENFLNFDLNEKKFDVVLFCQSLYMFSTINLVMEKVYDLLEKGGICLVVGERITPEFSGWNIKKIKRNILNLIRGRADCSGNHYYKDREYMISIVNSGLEYKFQLLNYPVYKNSVVMAGNHFGKK
jgi:ubiquinone/menaquinone biosynthesis C-methylase UbiE